jgi:hypothetical protein
MGAGRGGAARAATRAAGDLGKGRSRAPPVEGPGGGGSREADGQRGTPGGGAARRLRVGGKKYWLWYQVGMETLTLE